MNRIEKAREFRKRMEANLTATRKLIRVDELTEDELIEMIDLYPLYTVDINYKVYESLIDANTWSPTAYPQGWKIIE